MRNCSDFILRTGVPDDSEVKNLPANAGDVEVDLIPGSGRPPGRRHGNPLQYSCPRNATTEELAGYSPWGHKESDMNC